MNLIKERVLKESEMLIATKMTIRELAKINNVSKSTVHNDLTKRLIKVDKEKYDMVKKILNFHKEIRHINGGLATKLKYQVLKENNSK